MKDMTDKEFAAFRDYIKRNYGINLNDEKKSLVYSRLRTLLAELGFDDFSQYFEYLTNDKTGEAARKFINRISTNHTFFMRESNHFDYFRETALPYAEASDNKKNLRLWCAASSSGEEPYTLQMIIEDYFQDKPGWNTETLATDISTDALDKAVRGVFPAESVKALPATWRAKYFKKIDDDNMAVADFIKSKITFRKFNLMEETFPFRQKFQIIFVRNVMIYFDAATRDKLVEKFYNCMEDGGYLFIGHSESLNHTNTKFKYIMPAVYRK